MKTIEFFKESVRNIKTVGTITKSSPYLCRGMIKPVNFQKAKVIVELGAGDGVVTKHILKHMSKDCVLMTFEVNEKFVNNLNHIKDKRLIVVSDTAEKLEDYLVKHNCEHVDYILSAIPFVIVPDEIAHDIVTKCKKVLRNDGKFIQMHYSLVAKKIYNNIFGNVDVNFIPLNIPPAFVLVSDKTAPEPMSI